MYKYFISVSVVSKSPVEHEGDLLDRLRFILPTFYDCYADDYDEAKKKGLEMIDDIAKFGVEAEFCIFKRTGANRIFSRNSEFDVKFKD